MLPEEAFQIADEALIAQRGKGLTDLQRLILQKSLIGKTYSAMAEDTSYEYQHLANEGAALFKSLSEALGEKVGKTNFQGALERYFSKLKIQKCEEKIDRNSWLKLQLQRSRARCIARWQAVGVSEPNAITLTDDSSIGAPPFSLETIPNQLTLLIGGIGVGKSLIGDRLFQAAILKAEEDIDAPIPIYFRAGQLQNRQSLGKAVEKDVLDLGYPSSTSTLVIIDEVDDIGFNDASNLLQEARELVQLPQQITIVIISKPIPGFADTPESIKARLLDRETSINLIKRLSGKQHFSPDDLSRPLQEAILTPLFAVLLATYLRKNYVSLPESKFQLISNLVELFLHHLRDKVVQVNALLAKLAVACIDNGGAAVSANEVGSWFEQQQLLDSKLIIKESDNLQFPLPILTYWFAAQSLLADRSLVRNIVLDYSRLERWRYPLVIAIATFSSTQVAEILTPIAERQPAVAADVVTEALAFQGRSIHIPNQTALQIGEQVRRAMQAWIKGFDSLAHLIPFVQEDGTLPSIGVRFNQTEFAMVEVAWHSGNADLDDVESLPPYPTDHKQLVRQGWKDIREFLAYSHTSWVWKWTLERTVSSIIRSRSLPVPFGYLSREAAWFAALFLTNRRFGSVSPIDLDNLEALLSRIDASRYPPKLQHCLRQLVIEIDFARRNRETHLGLLPAIQQFKVSPSYETLIEYAESVYFGAFQGYMQLIDLLAPYLPHLPIASILPARLTIAVVLPNHTSHTVIWSWYWEPLPPDSQNEVALRVSDHTISNHDPEVQRALEKIQLLYPQWIEHFSVKPQQVSPCTELWLGHYPVTTLTYKWLWNDLKRVSWLTGNLEDSDITYWSTPSHYYSSGLD